MRPHSVRAIRTLAPLVPRTTVTQEIDNSSSMQIVLRQRLGDCFTVFENLAASGTFADMSCATVARST